MDKFTHKIKGFAKLTGVDQLPVKFGMDNNCLKGVVGKYRFFDI